MGKGRKLDHKKIYDYWKNNGGHMSMREMAKGLEIHYNTLLVIVRNNFKNKLSK